MPNLDALSLAGCHVSTDGTAESLVVALVSADINNTILEVGCCINSFVALLEWPILSDEDPAVPVLLVGLFLCFFTHRAVAGASIPTTRDLAYLPALCKLVDIGCWGPALHDQIITGVLVVIATEATKRIAVTLGNSDVDQSVPAKGHGKIKVGYYKDMGSADVGLHLIFMVEGQIHKYSIHLEETEKMLPRCQNIACQPKEGDRGGWIKNLTKRSIAGKEAPMALQMLLSFTSHYHNHCLC